ncbi:hypothetical protein PROFUN_00877 [Planoprotostelium fungivorum]|uniref:Uncharacterized protein n=1 Tax=Planoprotostelium fungivorum TaxID=1890364 RepID=A0A2P6P073_9EUKA|nr:hypothetical protein PROFUN_00877 [Planoprotostelium fungivorum]
MGKSILQHVLKKSMVKKISFEEAEGKTSPKSDRSPPTSPRQTTSPPVSPTMTRPRSTTPTSSYQSFSDSQLMEYQSVCIQFIILCLILAAITAGAELSYNRSYLPLWQECLLMSETPNYAGKSGSDLFRAVLFCASDGTTGVV